MYDWLKRLVNKPKSCHHALCLGEEGCHGYRGRDCGKLGEHAGSWGVQRGYSYTRRISVTCPTDSRYTFLFDISCLFGILAMSPFTLQLHHIFLLRHTSRTTVLIRICHFILSVFFGRTNRNFRMDFSFSAVILHGSFTTNKKMSIQINLFSQQTQQSFKLKKS